MMYLGVVVSFVIALALWWVVNAFVLKNEFNPVEVAFQIIVVLVAVSVAAIITKKAIKKEGIKVSVPKS